MDFAPEEDSPAKEDKLCDISKGEPVIPALFFYCPKKVTLRPFC